MGRQQENDGSVPQTRYVQAESRRKRLTAASLLVVAIFWLSRLNTDNLLHATSPQDPLLQQPTLFDWDTIETKTHLGYTPCYKDLQCARLELPMDWFNQTTNATISLAVIRQPAVVPVTHPQYGGAILLNPGGPGGSGVGLVLRAGQLAQSIVDTNTTDGLNLPMQHSGVCGRCLPPRVTFAPTQVVPLMAMTSRNMFQLHPQPAICLN
jgi:hypothetical protein